jgi:hypothetical protein
MRGIRVLAVTTLFALSLYGQKWQDLCFNNPTAPDCNGHNTAIKRQPAAAAPAPSPASVSRPFSSPANTRGGNAQVISVGAIDWRFADSNADIMMGFNFTTLANSPLTRMMIAQLGMWHTKRKYEASPTCQGGDYDSLWNLNPRSHNRG